MISNFIKKIYTKLNLKNLHLFSSRSYAKDYLSTAESFINLKNITSSSMPLISKPISLKNLKIPGPYIKVFYVP